MGGMASTARGPHAARRPHRRPPRRTRWARRIGGMLATLGLFGVAALMASMVIPARDHGAAALTTPDTLVAPAKAKDKGAKAKAKKPVKAKLTAKQLAARASAVTILRNQGYLPTR